MSAKKRPSSQILTSPFGTSSIFFFFFFSARLGAAKGQQKIPASKPHLGFFSPVFLVPPFPVPVLEVGVVIAANLILICALRRRVDRNKLLAPEPLDSSTDKYISDFLLCLPDLSLLGLLLVLVLFIFMFLLPI